MGEINNPRVRLNAGGTLTLKENEEVEVKPEIGPLGGVVGMRIVLANAGAGKYQISYEEGDLTFKFKSLTTDDTVFSWIAAAK